MRFTGHPRNTRALITAAIVAILGLAGVAPAAAPPSRPQTPTRPTTMPWQWPLDPPPALIRGFEKPARPWLPGHRGVDLATRPGATVRAPAAGILSFAGRVVDRNVLTLVHPGGLRSSFESAAPTIAIGEHVPAGAPLARVDEGPSHCPERTCLHWGVRLEDEYVNPLNLVSAARPSVLLPWSTPAQQVPP